MARYRPVQTIIWSDEDFLAMSDDAQLVWLHIFTNPLSNPLGIFKATVPGLAAEKGWSLERYRKGLQEGLPKRLGERLTKGLIDVDFSRHVVRFPNYFKHNKPDNPNVLKGWLKSWDEVPNCDLKIQHKAALYEACKRWGKGYVNVLETFGITLPQTLPQTSSKQEREREQEREQELTTTSADQNSNLLDENFEQENPHRQSVDENHPVWKWMPSQVVMKEISRFKIPVEFVSEQLSEFKVYRSGLKENFTNYDSKFLANVQRSWKLIGHAWQPNPIFNGGQNHDSRNQSGYQQTSRPKLSTVERYLLEDAERIRKLDDEIRELEAQERNEQALGVANG